MSHRAREHDLSEPYIKKSNEEPHQLPESEIMTSISVSHPSRILVSFILLYYVRKFMI